MKKTILQFFSLTMLLTFQFACKKSSPLQTNVITVRFHPEALKYVKLTPGKYFIYKDSASGTLDSVVVTNSTLMTASPTSLGSSYSLIADSFSLTLTNYASSSPKDWFIGGAAAKIFTGFFSIPHSSDSAVLNIEESYRNSGPLFTNTSAFYYPMDSTTSYIPDMNIEGVIYHDIIMGKTDNTSAYNISSPYYSRRVFYWAKGIGIIKRETVSTGGIIGTHLLIRHN